MRVYEFCGWLNTPDECAGKWYRDFPHPLDGRSPLPRVSYYDKSRGMHCAENFQVYVMSSEPHPRDQWKGPWPEGADMIVASPIQRVQWVKRDFPRYNVVKGNSFPIQEDMPFSSVYFPVVELVKSFTTQEGDVVVSTW